MVDNPNLVPQEAYDVVTDPGASNVTNLKAFDAVEKAARTRLDDDAEFASEAVQRVHNIVRGKSWREEWRPLDAR